MLVTAFVMDLVDPGSGRRMLAREVEQLRHKLDQAETLLEGSRDREADLQQRLALEGLYAEGDEKVAARRQLMLLHASAQSAAEAFAEQLVQAIEGCPPEHLPSRFMSFPGVWRGRMAAQRAERAKAIASLIASVPT